MTGMRVAYTFHLQALTDDEMQSNFSLGYPAQLISVSAVCSAASTTEELRVGLAGDASSAFQDQIGANNVPNLYTLKSDFVGGQYPRFMSDDNVQVSIAGTGLTNTTVVLTFLEG